MIISLIFNAKSLHNIGTHDLPQIPFLYLNYHVFLGNIVAWFPILFSTIHNVPSFRLVINQGYLAI